MKYRRRKRVLTFVVCTMLIFPAWILPKMDAEASFADTVKQVWEQAEAAFEWADTGLTPWNGEAKAPGAGEIEKVTNVNGDEINAYPVYTPEEFRYCMENQMNIKLMADLDMGAKEGKQWRSVNGVADDATHWVIDGNNYSIYNLDIRRSGVTERRVGGIFATSEYGRFFLMKNFTFRNARNIGDNNQSISIIGALHCGTLENIGIEDALVYGGQLVAGFIAGFSDALTYPLKVDNCYTKGVTAYSALSCVASFIDIGSNIEVTNCYTIDGSAIAAYDQPSPVMLVSGHSGGFVSCLFNGGKIENCFTNVDAYGYDSTGAFVGVVEGPNTGRSMDIKNCYASGKIHGIEKLSGFFGGNGSNRYEVNVENCYSTAGVGLDETAENIGGFHGPGSGGVTYNTMFQYKNCYMAGEVGTENTSASSGSVYAVSASGSQTYAEKHENMYYDKQTTGMRERASGISFSGIEGMLTKDLVNTYIDGKDEDESAWELAEGTYPQLKVFTNPDTFHSEESRQVAKAYSQASVSTAILYPSYLEKDKYDEVLAEDSSDYDTVRSIRYAFPLTNNNLIGNRSEMFDMTWKTDGAKSRLSQLSDIDVITLSEYPDYRVNSTAPGVSKLSVEAALTDASGNILEVGKRNQRLIPKNAFVINEPNKVIYHVRDGTARESLDEKHRRFDIRSSMIFVYIEEGDTISDENAKVLSVPQVNLKYENNTLIVDAEMLKDSGIEGEVKIQVYDEEENPVIIDENIYKLLTGQRDPLLEEIGKYVLKYQWYMNGFGYESGIIEREQDLMIKLAPEVTYHYKTAEGSKTTDTAYIDHGPYLEGDAAKDPGLNPVLGAETGYEFAGWAETDDPDSINPDTFTDWYDPSAIDNYLDGDRTIWAIYKGDGPGTIELEVSDTVHYGIKANADGTGGNPIPVKKTEYSIEDMTLKVEDQRKMEAQR